MHRKLRRLLEAPKSWFSSSVEYFNPEFDTCTDLAPKLQNVAAAT